MQKKNFFINFLKILLSLSKIYFLIEKTKILILLFFTICNYLSLSIAQEKKQLYDENITQKNNIIIYCNNNTFYLKGISFFDSIEIFSVIGNKVFQANNQYFNNEYKIAIPKLKKEQLYIVRIRIENDIKTFKFIAH